MLNKIYFGITILSLFFFLANCTNTKNSIINKENVKTSQNPTKLNQDSIEIVYTEKLLNEKPISDLKGSKSVEILSAALPQDIIGFESRPISSSKMDDNGSIIVVVKGQYIKSDNTIVTVDITDYSPQKKVLAPESYTTKIPEIQNFDTKAYKDSRDNGQGYITWNPVKNMGWLNLLYYERFNVKIRAHGPSASKELMVEFLSKVNTKLFEEN